MGPQNDSLTKESPDMAILRVHVAPEQSLIIWALFSR